MRHELVLLHGMGGNNDVWDPLHRVLSSAAHPFPDGWLAITLPYHGGVDDGHVPVSFRGMAEAVVDDLSPDARTTLLGHSLGGVVALELARMLGPERVVRTIALGVKVRWTQEELDGAAALAAKPMRVFPTRQEAIERAVRIAGLGGDAPPPPEFLVSCANEVEGGWQPTFDPRVLAVGAPDMPRLVAGAPGEVVLARGEHDPMQTDAQLQALAGPGARVITLPGLGHSPHVQAPAEVASLLHAPLDVAPER